MAADRAMSARARALAAWGEPLPDWVAALAAEADRTSQARAAAALGYSDAVVSQILGRRYPGDLARIELAVRGAFLGQSVDCPGQNGRPMPANECIGWQRRRYDGSNHVAVRMYRACRSGCPHSTIGEA